MTYVEAHNKPRGGRGAGRRRMTTPPASAG